ncbi:DUF5667 domain-containing protein [Jatrophihabitans sp. DSM 45814]
MSTGRFASGRRRTSAFESELIARLRVLPAGPVPDATFKSDLRAQLVAITARIVSESTVSGSAVSGSALPQSSGSHRTIAQRPAPPGLRTGRGRSRGAIRAVRRPILAFASAAAVLALLLGIAVWVSGGALPGDSLYGVKRASENVKLSVAGNDVDKGYVYLRLASKRGNEAKKLLGRPSALGAGHGGVVAAGQISERTASLVTDTLGSMDSDSRSGMQLLARAAVSQKSASPFDKLGRWTAAQRAQLSEISSRIPTANVALTARVQASLTLVTRIETRAAQLKAEIGCSCLSQASSDDLGPVPCSPCTATPGKPGARSGPTSGTGPGGQPGISGSAGNSSQGPAGGASASVGGSAAIGSDGSVGASGGATVAPRAPGLSGISSAPKAPITLDSNGLQVTVPGVGASAGVGTGGVSAKLPVPVTSVKVPGLIKIN